MIARALAIATLLACGVAFAAPPDNVAAVRTRAKARIKKARAAYASGNYDLAISEYQAAFEILPTATDILFNLGQIQRVKNDKPAAVAAYRKYLDAEPRGPHAPEARDFLQQLTLAQVPEAARGHWDAVEKAVQDKPGDAANRFAALQLRVGAGDPANLDAELTAIQVELKQSEPRIDAPTSKRAVAATVVTPPPAPARSTDKPYLKKWWFWTAVAGGVVIVAGAVTGIAIAAQPSDPTPTLGVLK